MLVLEGEGIGTADGLTGDGIDGSGALGAVATVHEGAHGDVLIGPAHGRVHRDLRRRAVRRLDQGPQMNTQSGGLLLHHAGQLPASDNGENGCDHLPRLPADGEPPTPRRPRSSSAPYAGRRAQPVRPRPIAALRAAGPRCA